MHTVKPHSQQSQDWRTVERVGGMRNLERNKRLLSTWKQYEASFAGSRRARGHQWVRGSSSASLNPRRKAPRPCRHIQLSLKAEERSGVSRSGVVCFLFRERNKKISASSIRGPLCYTCKSNS